MTHCCLIFPIKCGLHTYAVFTYLGLLVHIGLIIVLILLSEVVDSFRPDPDSTNEEYSELHDKINEEIDEANDIHRWLITWHIIVCVL